MNLNFKARKSAQQDSDKRLATAKSKGVWRHFTCELFFLFRNAALRLKIGLILVRSFRITKRTALLLEWFAWRAFSLSFDLSLQSVVSHRSTVAQGIRRVVMSVLARSLPGAVVVVVGRL